VIGAQLLRAVQIERVLLQIDLFDMAVSEKPRWLTVKEVAYLLDLSEVSVRRKIRAGQIPGVFQLGGPGNAIRILEDELERWLLTDVSDGSLLGQIPAQSPFERRGTQAMRGQSNPPAHAGPEQ
jgi:excisionase family DNA binding protein